MIVMKYIKLILFFLVFIAIILAAQNYTPEAIKIERGLERCGEGYFLTKLEVKDDKYLVFDDVWTCKDGNCLTSVKNENSLYYRKYNIDGFTLSKISKLEGNYIQYCRQYDYWMDCGFNIFNSILDDTFKKINSIGLIMKGNTIFTLSNTTDNNICDEKQIISILKTL